MSGLLPGKHGIILAIQGGCSNEPSSSFDPGLVMLVAMRQLRRLTALITSLLMMHLVIASGATACPMGDDVVNAGASVEASHGVEHAGATTGHNEPMSGHHDNAPTRPAHRHTHSGSHCATPCPPSGCASLGHCGSASLSAMRDGAEPGLVTASGLIIARTVAVHSVSTAPEPPPPRA